MKHFFQLLAFLSLVTQLSGQVYSEHKIYIWEDTVSNKNHAEFVINAFEDEWAKHNSDSAEILVGNYSHYWTLHHQDREISIINRSYTGQMDTSVTDHQYFQNEIIWVVPMGSNFSEEVTNSVALQPAVRVAHSSSLAINFRTGYGKGMDFVQPDDCLCQSGASPRVAAKLLSIKRKLEDQAGHEIPWYEVIYRARLTAYQTEFSHNYENSTYVAHIPGKLYNEQNGFGIIDVDAAVAYAGAIPLVDPLVEYGFLSYGWPLTSSVSERFRMVSNGTPTWNTVNDSTYSATINFQTDLTGNSYLATGIDTSFRVFSGRHQMYKIDSIWSVTFSAVSVRVVEYGNTDGEPTGQVMVFNSDGAESVPSVPTGSTGSTAQLQAAIISWNAGLLNSSEATTYAPSDLSQEGATTGDIITWDGSQYAPQGFSAIQEMTSNVTRTVCSDTCDFTTISAAIEDAAKYREAGNFQYTIEVHRPSDGSKPKLSSPFEINGELSHVTLTTLNDTLETVNSGFSNTKGYIDINASGLTLKDFKFQRGQFSSAMVGIRFINSSNITLDAVEIIDFNGGQGIRYGSAGAVHVENSTGIEIQNLKGVNSKHVLSLTNSTANLDRFTVDASNSTAAQVGNGSVLNFVDYGLRSVDVRYEVLSGGSLVAGQYTSWSASDRVDFYGGMAFVNTSSSLFSSNIAPNTFDNNGYILAPNLSGGNTAFTLPVVTSAPPSPIEGGLMYHRSFGAPVQYSDGTKWIGLTSFLSYSTTSVPSGLLSEGIAYYNTDDKQVKISRDGLSFEPLIPKDTIVMTFPLLKYTGAAVDTIASNQTYYFSPVTQAMANRKIAKLEISTTKEVDQDLGFWLWSEDIENATNTVVLPIAPATFFTIPANTKNISWDGTDAEIPASGKDGLTLGDMFFIETMNGAVDGAGGLEDYEATEGENGLYLTLYFIE